MADRALTPRPGGRAKSDDPGAAWIRHMRRGDFAAAWAVSDAVLAARAGAPCGHLPRHEQALWDGTPLAGRRVLVHCYHGLGDTLQFARFLPRVGALAAELTVWTQPELLPLLSTLPDAGRLLPLHDGAPGVDRDVDVEIMELSHVLRVDPRELAACVPYLRAAPSPLPRDGRLAVGLVWRAGPWDHRRTVPFPLLAPLAEVPGVRLHLLQHDLAPGERHAGLGRIGDTADPLRTAREMRALDLVVTVDSMPAHLAGALGVRVWTLLPSEADWRWMDGRDDSPWYPTMRLFRQERPGEWAPVIARVAGELAALSREK